MFLNLIFLICKLGTTKCPWSMSDWEEKRTQHRVPHGGGTVVPGGGTLSHQLPIL